MGVRDTARGLGCMAKGAGCLLAIFAGYLLLQYLWVGFVLGCAYVLGALARFHQLYWQQILIAIGIVALVAVIAIILVIANAIGKESD